MKNISVAFVFCLVCVCAFSSSAVLLAQDENNVPIDDESNISQLESFQAFLNEIQEKILSLQDTLSQLSAAISGGYGKGTKILTLNKSGKGSGTVSSSPSGIDCGSACSRQSADFTSNTSVTLYASAASDSNFNGWSGACGGKSSSCLVKMSSARSVTASFEKSYTLEVYKSGSGYGIVKSSPSGIDCGSKCTAVFSPNANVKLTPAPVQGYVFSRWSGCDSVSNKICTVKINAKRSVAAYFEPAITETYTLTLVKSGGSAIRRVYSVPMDRPSGLDCLSSQTTCDAKFYKNIEVNLLVDAYDVSVNWNAAGNLANRCDRVSDRVCYVTMNRDRTIYVSFSRR